MNMKKLILLTILVAAVLLATTAPALALTNTDCLACHGAPDGTAVAKLVPFGVQDVTASIDKCVACHPGMVNPSAHGAAPSSASPSVIHSAHSGVGKQGYTYAPCTEACHYEKVQCSWCHDGQVPHQLDKHGNGTANPIVAPVEDSQWLTVVAGRPQVVTLSVTCIASTCHAVTAPVAPSLQPNIRLAPACGQAGCHGSESHEVVHEPSVAITTEYGATGENCVACHDLNLVAEHLTNQPLGCGTCHDSTVAAVAGAIAAYKADGTKAGCRECHGASAGMHTPQHALENPVQPPANCQSASCHVDNLVTEHVDRRGLVCDTCHAGSTEVQQVITAFKDVAQNSTCEDCHGASGHVLQHDLLAPVAPPAECQYCHTTNLLPVHIDPAFPADVNDSTWNTMWNCDTCHAAGSRVESEVAALAANTAANPDCATCHVVTGIHVDRHLTTSTECFDAGCHASTNLATLHAGYGRTCDTCHTSTPRAGVREAILANDTSCERCHMAGHFQQHDLPAGKEIGSGYYSYSNQGSGTTDCAMCHTNNVILEHTGDSTTGRPAWLAANGSPLSCDTCHQSTRAAVVAAIAAASTDQLTNCDQCHTVHGTPTLEHQSPTSAPGESCGDAGCHNQNLLVEHELRWSVSATEVQNNTAILGGVCGRCHLGQTGALSKTLVLTAINDADTTCQACHGANAGAGHTATHDPDATLSSTYASCADPGCHVLNIATQHVGDTFKDGTIGSCATCHSTTAPQYAKDAIAAWKNTGAKQGCFVCHGGDAGAHVTQHALTDPVQPPADCQSSTCHVDNLVTEHVDRRALDCATCHSGSSAVQQVIATYRTGGTKAAMNPTCAECHGPNAGQHVQQHELANPTVPECTLCHSGNLVTEHTVDNPLGCDACHGSGASATVKSVIATYGGANPLNPVCTDCHTAYHAGAVAKHTANEGTDCKSCHLMMLPDEHARSTSISNSRSCGNCHPLPATFVWTYKCADCHTTGGLAPVRHSAENAKHVSSQTDCAKSGCHSSDLKSVHSAVGCNVCHTTTSVPSSSDCRTCHTSGMHHDVAPTFKFGTTSSANIRQACETACHEHDSTHQSGQDCWGRCHGPGEREDFHTVESDHQQSSACAKCHNASTAQANACRSCHSFGTNWWVPYGTPTTTTTTTTSSTTTTSTSTTTTTSTTVPPATTEYKVNNAEYLDDLNNSDPDDRADRRYDVTSKMGDSSYGAWYEIKRDRRMMSLQLNQSGSTVKTAVLRLYVNSLKDGNTQKIRVYRYTSYKYVASSYSEYTVSKTGWIDLDVTNLVKATSGSWFKLRVTCGSDDYDISEARYVLTR